MINVTQTFLPPIDEFVSHLEKVWETRWITNRGEFVLELEEKLKVRLGVPNLLAVNNGTIALQIAIKALGLKGEIITSPFSYVATVSSIVWENCTPVFVDIDRKYLTINEELIEAAITENTSAILATHVYGNPCEVEAIQRVADRHGLKVIYDAAHCFGVKYKGESILNAGDVSTLSFHATKTFHTGEGGAIVCGDDELAKTIFYHHNFGHNGPEAFWGLGINGKMSEINAAMGLSLLPYIDEIHARRKHVCDRYRERLDGSELELLRIRDGAEWNYSYFPVLFPSESALLDAFRNLTAGGIHPRRYFYPSLNQLPYARGADCPVAEDVSRRVLCLPVYAELAVSDVDRVCDRLREVS